MPAVLPCIRSDEIGYAEGNGQHDPGSDDHTEYNGGQRVSHAESEQRRNQCAGPGARPRQRNGDEQDQSDHPVASDLLSLMLGFLLHSRDPGVQPSAFRAQPHSRPNAL